MFDCFYKVHYRPALPTDYELFDALQAQSDAHLSAHDRKKKFEQWFIDSSPDRFFNWYAQYGSDRTVFDLSKKAQKSNTPRPLHLQINIDGQDEISFSGLDLAEFKSSRDHTLLFASSNSDWFSNYCDRTYLQTDTDWSEVSTLQKSLTYTRLLSATISHCVDEGLVTILSINHDVDQIIQYCSSRNAVPGFTANTFTRPKT